MINDKKIYFEILVHPWETLRDVLNWENMTQSELSLRTEISEKHISNIIKWKANITPETALKFHKVFWTSANFWNNLQKYYDENKARLEEKKLMGAKLEEEKTILCEIKSWYKNLAENGFVEKINFRWEENKKIILNNLYSFFKVSSLKNILDIFNIWELDLKFKKSNWLRLNKYNLACWLRAWEVKLENIEVWEYSKTNLNKVLIKLKSMTMQKVVDIKEIQRLIASAWIYFSFVNWFENVPVFWVTRKYRWKAFVQVSDKWKRNDWFWFALFHELAHVKLHLNSRNIFLINLDNQEEEKEREANVWAWDYLINPKDFENFTKKLPISRDRFLEFSVRQWVWDSILAWRLGFHYNELWHRDAYKEVSEFREGLKVVEG